MKRPIRPSETHATSRYTAVSEGLIHALQEDYFANLPVGSSVPHLEPARAAIIVAESLEADELLEKLTNALLTEMPLQPWSGQRSDWTIATAAELFFAVADVAESDGDEEQKTNALAVAWAMVEHIALSPTASPTLWYEDIYRDLGNKLRYLGEREALEYYKRALAHNLHYEEGTNTEYLLRELAETHLHLDDVEEGLGILIALVRHDPADVWPYNTMALCFCSIGLTEVGVEATRRGLELCEQTGDPVGLRDQLLKALDRLQSSERRGREADVDPETLAELRAALQLDFSTGEERPISELCRELVPDLDQIPVKRLAEPVNLPPPEEMAQRLGLFPATKKPSRNAPCWCGSGKKYKHCHWRSDRLAQTPLPDVYTNEGSAEAS